MQNARLVLLLALMTPALAQDEEPAEFENAEFRLQALDLGAMAAGANAFRRPSPT